MDDDDTNSYSGEPLDEVHNRWVRKRKADYDFRLKVKVRTMRFFKLIAALVPWVGGLIALTLNQDIMEALKWWK